MVRAESTFATVQDVDRENVRIAIIAGDGHAQAAAWWRSVPIVVSRRSQAEWIRSRVLSRRLDHPRRLQACGRRWFSSPKRIAGFVS
jgi:hypothetical protein